MTQPGTLREYFFCGFARVSFTVTVNTQIMRLLGIVSESNEKQGYRGTFPGTICESEHAYGEGTPSG